MSAQPFSDAEISLIDSAQREVPKPDDLEIVSIAGKPIDDPQGIDSELQSMRLIKPGETIFSWQQGFDGGQPARFDAKMQGNLDEVTEVVIYTKEGFARQMMRKMALIRLRKRDPQTGRPVFFTRPPQQAPIPTIPCRVAGCSKKFFDEAAQQVHWAGRHSAHWQQHNRAERIRKENEQSEIARLQLEQSRIQTEALQAILHGPQVDIEAVIMDPAGNDYQKVPVSAYRAYCDEHDIQYPADAQKFSKAKWIALIREWLEDQERMIVPASSEASL